MKVVVADTSPLNYLILIGAVEVPPGLHGRICVPAEVVAELNAAGAPAEIAEWLPSMTIHRWQHWTRVSDLPFCSRRWPAMHFSYPRCAQTGCNQRSDWPALGTRSIIEHEFPRLPSPRRQPDLEDRERG